MKPKVKNLKTNEKLWGFFGVWGGVVFVVVFVLFLGTRFEHGFLVPMVDKEIISLVKV